MSPEENSIQISRHHKDHPHQCEWASSHPLKAWIEGKGGEKANLLSQLELQHPSPGSSYLEDVSSREKAQDLHILSIHGGQEEKHEDKRGLSAVRERESEGGDVGEALRGQSIEGPLGHVKKCAGGLWRVLSRGMICSDLDSRRVIVTAVCARLWRNNKSVKGETN